MAGGQTCNACSCPPFSFTSAYVGPRDSANTTFEIGVSPQRTTSRMSLNIHGGCAEVVRSLLRLVLNAGIRRIRRHNQPATNSGALVLDVKFVSLALFSMFPGYLRRMTADSVSI